MSHSSVLRSCVTLLLASALLGTTAGAAAPVESAPADAAPAAGHAMEEITVTAQRTTIEQARAAQFEAPNLVDIATYEEIRKLPDVSVAEAVRRIPGISLETDEGEGRYVNIRGFDADLNSTTFGGLRLPPTNNASPFGGYRAVTLDSIPIGLVGALTVTKSNLPSQDAEALGGTIEITPKTAPTDGAPFLQGNVGSGYEPLRGTGIIDFAVTTGGRFGGAGRPAGSSVSAYSDRPFSIVATVSYNENKRGIDDVEPAYFNDANHPYQAINNLQQRDYELHRKRHGYGLDLGYQPDADNQFYLSAFDAGYTESYLRQFLNLNPDGNTFAAGNGLMDTLAGGSAIQKALRDEKETSRDLVFVAGGKNVFGANKLDYRVGFTKGSWDKAYDYNSAFNYIAPSTTPTISYSLTNPGNTPAYTITGTSYLDPKNYLLSGFANSTAYNYDKELSFAANLELPVQWAGSGTETLKLGASARLRHKLTTSQPYSYPTLPGLLLSDASSGANETYYASRYWNGGDIRPGYLQSILGSGTIAASDTTSSLQQFLDAKEDIYAIYGQYEMTAGALGLVGGVRVEQTRDRANAYSAGVDASGVPFANPVSASHSYTNLFPSIQLRYQLETDLIARATWSSTIARPGFNQSNAALSIDLGAGIVTTGNPYLKPATANSFDLSIEKYLGAAGILSLGIFDKEISHYIVANVLPNQTLPNTGLYPGNSLPLKIFTYTNAGASFARGMELNWEQRFRNAPGFLSGLGVGANYTYVDSRFQIRPGESAPLPSTSKNTWNASVFYEQHGLSLRLVAYSVSADLFGIGGDRSGDVFNGRRTSMDFGSSYAFTDHLTVYAEAKNLLNTPHVFYQGTTDRPIQREFYSQDYLVGLRFDF